MGIKPHHPFKSQNKWDQVDLWLNRIRDDKIKKGANGIPESIASALSIQEKHTAAATISPE